MRTRLLIAFLVGTAALGASAQGFGWWRAKVKLKKDHKAGETVQCDTAFAVFKTVSCEE